MRVSSLLVLGLVLLSAFVSSAPVEKAPEQSEHAEVVEVAKRDQEMILFGNQQNDPRVKKKKSDPATPVIPDDNTVDKQGFIKAVPVISEQKVEADDSQEQTAVEAGDTEQAAELELPQIKQQIPEEISEEITEETSEPVANADYVEEELKGIMADSNSQEEAQEVEAAAAGEEVPEVTAEVPTVEVESDNEVPEESEEESTEVKAPIEEEEVKETELVPAETDDRNPLYDVYLSYLLNNEKPQDEPQPGDYYYDMNYFPYRRRRSSRQSRAVTEGGMTHNDLQRSKRIKRDLFEDEEGYYYPYKEESYAPADLSDEDLYELYRIEPKYEDEVATLLDMYQQAPEQPSYQPYEQYPVEDVYPELYEEAVEEEEEPEYVPSKRQMLSSLPGIRKRYFYPFSREPQTHWGAFVPEQKRDYDQTYMRLLALASALSEESPYYQTYRKK